MIQWTSPKRLRALEQPWRSMPPAGDGNATALGAAFAEVVKEVGASSSTPQDVTSAASGGRKSDWTCSLEFSWQAKKKS